MQYKDIAVLTSRESWFVPYAKSFTRKLRRLGYNSILFYDSQEIGDKFKVLFILSYFKLLPNGELRKRKHNIVVHESDLPNGRGWSPLAWQILEGKNKIPIVLFEAVEDVDAGDIYLTDFIDLKGDELYPEIKRKQAEKKIEMCLKFLENLSSLKARKQIGSGRFYGKRIPKDSELDINKNIKSQFNLLRIVDNENFPAFFFYMGTKYILKITKDEK